ncbi:MAG: hypothetical protein ACE5PM_08990 [Candidatus Hydrothermarchaeales archaeon]
MKKMMRINGCRINRRGINRVVTAMTSAIILTAVALAIGVTLWTGAFTYKFMVTEQLVIASATYDDSNNILTIKARNMGTEAITLSSLTVEPGIGSISSSMLTTTGGGTYTSFDTSIPGGTAITIVIQGLPLTVGNNYEIVFLTTRGNKFIYVFTA